MGRGRNHFFGGNQDRAGLGLQLGGALPCCALELFNSNNFATIIGRRYALYLVSF